MQAQELFPIPVVFIIFNRPETTEKVFSEIQKIKPKQLFVIADGPRAQVPGEKEKCDAVRDMVLNGIHWNCQIMTNFSEINLGCKIRISSGLNWVFSHVDCAIILEDDCLPNPSFFHFCELMLKKYKDDPRIMMIAGTNYLSEKECPDFSYFFSQLFPIWGWATWKRAWTLYDINMTHWPLMKKDEYLKSIYNNKLFIHYIERIFDDVFSGKDDTWDAQWFYSCIVHRGLCIMPSKNLVSNIGIAGTRPQIKQFINRPIFQLNLLNINEPPIILVHPKIERNELKNLLNMAGYSYFKYFCTILLKRIGIFNFIENIYLKIRG